MGGRGVGCKGCAIKFALLFAAAFPARSDAARVAWLFTQSSAECVLRQRNRYKRISPNGFLFVYLFMPMRVLSTDEFLLALAMRRFLFQLGSTRHRLGHNARDTPNSYFNINGHQGVTDCEFIHLQSLPVSLALTLSLFLSPLPRGLF